MKRKNSIKIKFFHSSKGNVIKVAFECKFLSECSKEGDRVYFYVPKDIRVLLQSYIAPANPKTNEEYASILIELGLLRENNGTYSFNEVAMGQISHLVVFLHWFISQEKIKQFPLISYKSYH